MPLDSLTTSALPQVSSQPPSAPTPSSAPEVLLFRRELRRSFKAWCIYYMAKIGRAPALHHLLIIDTIEKLLANKLGYKNVILLMPPGSAKSTYTSVLLPSWFLNPEQFPTELMLACSYSYTLIEGFGKRSRDIVVQESKALGIQISQTAAAAGDWRTNRGGGYFCAGVNAGIAGHRAGLGLIDDYIGSEEEADSKLIRDKNWSWYWNDFVPRLLPTAWQLLIANRRHEDDLVGRLIAEDAKNWLVISLPMVAEDHDALGRKPGERLWPEWFTEAQVERARKIPRTWAGLYQQRPAPDEGNFFKREDLLTYKIDELPTNLKFYGASDWALRKGQTNDRHCHMVAGLDSNGRLWILPNFFWDRADTLESTNELFKLNRQFAVLHWWHGRENITGSVGPFIHERMRNEQFYFPIDELGETADKQAKAQAFKAWTQAKMVMFPGFHPKWELLLAELLAFPAGTHDDAVDTLGKFGQGLNFMARGESNTSIGDTTLHTPRLTCGWIQRSAKRKERLDRREQYSIN